MSGLRVRLVVAAVGGLLLAGAFPPLACWWLAPLGVATATFALHGVAPRRAWLLAGVTGVGFFLPAVSWVRTIGIDAWLLLTLLEAFVLSLLGPVCSVLMRRRAWPLTVAAAWVLVEAVRARVPFGGYPWARLAFSQPGSPFTPFVSVGGAPLLSALVALSGTAIAAAVLQRELRVRAGWAGLAVAVPAVGLLIAVPTAGQDGPGGSAVVVAAVQGNVPRLGLEFNAQRRAVLDRHVQATVTLARRVAAGEVPKPAFVVWPENSTDLDPFTEPDVRTQIETAVDAIGVPVLVGAVLDGPGPDHVTNAGVVWAPAGPTGQRYVKRHLVPFGEYVPFRSVLTKLVGRLRDDIPQDFAPGHHESGSLDIAGIRVADSICFEVGDDALVRDGVEHGGRLLVVQTNNATYGHSSESSQQLAIVRVRAVEHGRAAVMASTSGVSALVRPDGRVIAKSGIFTQAELVASLPLRSSRTLADHLRWWPELLLCLIALGACAPAAIGAARARVRRRSAAGGGEGESVARG
ncbi:MAG TPA: apolipoprotein N-acyltransferase [Mycobacteriales bacterium]|nr:apolipoprotein N-acyltransferase [Mycobacteriales bacterium]